MTPVNANRSIMDRKTVTHAHLAPSSYGWFALRIVLAGIFLWAFVDKLFGLGYSTKSASAWINGGSPTNGFLGHAGGYFANFYHAIAGNVVTDTLFMAALLGLGLALVFGVGLRVAAVAGTLLMLGMWSITTLGATGTTNPIIDDHLVYASIFIALALSTSASAIGLGRVKMVREHPILQ